MSLYGNITNMSRSHFQFDKIYPNRYIMEQNLVTDEVFAGRFVLVEYDIDGEFSESDILIGYKKESDDNIYVDVDCTKPYYYATLFAVVTPLAENWQQYYLKYGSKYPLYYKLPSEDYFNSEEQNYYKIHESYPVERIPYIVTKDQIVRIKNSDGTFTSLYYKCTNTDAEPTSADVATWEQINIEQTESEYFKNYNIDKSFYGESVEYGPGNRGYDATVWQKVYSSGVGKYVLIAHLNSMVPTFIMQADAPSLYPAAPYIGAASTDMLYNVHVPTHWGFQIKEAEKVVDPVTNEDIYPKSDQTVIRQNKIYDEYNHEIGYEDKSIHAEIYFNKNGIIKLTRNYDDSTLNEILITPTGESGKVYFNSNGEQVTIDTYELAIHLPVIGNLISDFYDIFYTQNRNLDTQWYSANDSRVSTGDSYLNYKTRNLNSVAGLINTFQDRLGQIIISINSPISYEQAQSLDENYIYSFENNGVTKYYRIGKGYNYEIVPEYSLINLTSDTFETNKYYYLVGNDYQLAISFDSNVDYYQKNISYTQISLNQETYEPNTYYLDNQGENIANQAYSYYQVNQNFYKKNVSTFKFKEVDLLSYSANTYYYRLGNDYRLDTQDYTPTYQTQPYFSITSSNEETFNFDVAYEANRYYKKDENNNYILSEDLIPNNLIDYYNIKVLYLDETGIIYRPNVYYYFENYENGQPIGNPILATDDSATSGIRYFYIPLQNEPVYVINNGEIIVGYVLDVDNKQEVSLINVNNLSNHYVHENNTYIASSNIDNYTTSYDWYYIEMEKINSYFVPNEYYLKENNNYILQTDISSFNKNYTYIKLNNIEPLPIPFYEAGKYYWNNGNIYLIDDGIEKTHDKYYIGTSLYVYDDYTERWPVGFEWKEQALFVPASVTLATRTEIKKAFEIDGINNGSSSINGSILFFNNLISKNNNDLRDKTTLTGAINNANDLLNSVKTNLIPGRILYINDFGQIDVSSISIQDLQTIINNS